MSIHNDNNEGKISARSSKTLQDFPQPKTKSNGEQDDGGKRQGNTSIFNRYSLFYYGGLNGTNKPVDVIDTDTFNAPYTNPNAQTIITETQGNGAMEYEWSDFLYCRDYGQIPNNYMITLRRFGQPINDNLLRNDNHPDISRTLTWVSEEANQLSDILSFSLGVNWRELKSQIQSIDQSRLGIGGGSGFLGKLLNIGTLTDTSGARARESLVGEKALNFDPVSNYTNRVYGPIDVIDQMMVRDRGLNFSQDITLEFNYELRGIDGINPKQAMLDLISNLLVLTYTKAEFWGGDRLYYGKKPHQLLGDRSLLESGDAAGYFKSVLGGLVGSFEDLTGGQGGIQGIINAVKTIGGNAMSKFLGGSLDKMGRPDVIAIHSLLTGEDTGEWHLTVGNPLNPIYMMGNLIVTNTKFTLDGPLGIDDFPTKLKMEVTLQPARPRDKTEIESMFNLGQGRMYGSSIDLIEKGYYQNYNLHSKGSGKPKSPAEIVNSNISSTNELSNAVRFPNYQGQLGKQINKSYWAS